jgi:hypothetical protein
MKRNPTKPMTDMELLEQAEQHLIHAGLLLRHAGETMTATEHIILLPLIRQTRETESAVGQLIAARVADRHEAATRGKS